LWVDPYDPGDRSKWTWTPIGRQRYQQIIKSESEQIDPFGVITRTARTTGPSGERSLDLSGIGARPESYTGEDVELSAAPGATAAPPAARPAVQPGAAQPQSVAETMVIPHPKGLIAPGNLPIWNRPVVQNADGTHSTELSIGIGDEQGHEVLIPTIVDGKFLTPDGKMPSGPMPKEGQAPSPEWKALFDAAVAHYRQTGQHLGIFDNPADASVYSNALHSRKPRAAHTPAVHPVHAPAPVASPQQLKAQVPNVPVRVDALHHPDGPGVYGAARTTDNDGHIPADAQGTDGKPVNPGLREAANQLLDGMDIKEVQLPPRDKEFAAGLARMYGWGRGPYTPRELKQMQNARMFLDKVGSSKAFMRLLDSGTWDRVQASVAEMDASKLGLIPTVVHQLAVTSGSPDQQEYVRLRQAMMGTVSGLSAVVRSGMPTEATISRLAQEIPDVMAAPNSKDAHERIRNIKAELDLAMRQGVPPPINKSAPSGTLEEKTKQVQKALNGNSDASDDPMPKGTPLYLGTKKYTYNGTGDTGELSNYTEVKQ
jgi:hypothetical protein